MLLAIVALFVVGVDEVGEVLHARMRGTGRILGNPECRTRHLAIHPNHVELGNNPLGRLEKMVCSTHSLEGQPNRPNDVICDGKKSGHRQKPAVTFTRPKFMQEIPEEDS